MPTRRDFFKTAALAGAVWPASHWPAKAVLLDDTVIVTPEDSRYTSLIRGNNPRFTASPKAVYLCGDEEGIADAVKAALRTPNRKITVRSGGHCYENFVCDNHGGILADVSPMKNITREPDGTYAVDAGCTIGDAYTQLYTKYGVTIPLGTCFSVGLGGHITGGGFGVLSRQFGLCVDYLHAVSLVYVDERGDVVLEKFSLDDPKGRPVVWAHQGGGGGNFGIVTRFWFKDLPKAPGTVHRNSLSWKWEDLDRRSFGSLVQGFGQYLESHSAPDTPYTGLFVSMSLRHRSTGWLSVGAQYAGDRPEILDEFVDFIRDQVGVNPICRGENESSCKNSLPWFELAQRQAGGGPSQYRLKYKSTYMKRTFPDRQVDVLYRYLSEKQGPPADWFTLLHDGYGGQVNRVASDAMAIPQRDSIFKMQYILGWKGDELDAPCIEWLRDFYRDMYADEGGEPMSNDVYDGCYLNYADADLVNWPYLYYKENYPRLQQIKARLDPHNIFHHAQSIALP